MCPMVFLLTIFHFHITVILLTLFTVTHSLFLLLYTQQISLFTGAPAIL